MGFIRLIIAFSFLWRSPLKARHFPSIAKYFLSSYPVKVKKIPRFLESESPHNASEMENFRRCQHVEKVYFSGCSKACPVSDTGCPDARLPTSPSREAYFEVR
jgi:hypothetical protein